MIKSIFTLFKLNLGSSLAPVLHVSHNNICIALTVLFLNDTFKEIIAIAAFLFGTPTFVRVTNTARSHPDTRIPKYANT